MTNEDIFNGARSAFIGYFSLFDAVSKEIGRERAETLLSNANKASATEMAQGVKEQMGDSGFDLEAAATMARNAIDESYGIGSEVIEESPERVVFKVGRCSVFEAGQAAGMSPETIEAQCRAGAVTYMNTLVNQLNPNLGYELVKCRSAADGFCEEAIVRK